MANIPQPLLDEQKALIDGLEALGKRLHGMQDAATILITPLDTLERVISGDLKTKIESRVSTETDKDTLAVLANIEKERQEIEGTVAMIHNLLHDFSAHNTGNAGLDLLMVLSDAIEKSREISTYILANISNIDGDKDKLKEMDTALISYNECFDDVYELSNTLRATTIGDASTQTGTVEGYSSRIITQVDSTSKSIIDHLEMQIKPIDGAAEFPQEIFKVITNVRDALQFLFATADTKGMAPHLDALEGYKK